MTPPRPSLLVRTSLPGTSHCRDAAGLQTALSSGAKQIIAGEYVHELTGMMPLPHVDDVLQLVAEGRLLHGVEAASMLAHAIHVRVHLTESSRPTLQLVLAELLQNAVEHGNLGLSMTRNSQVNELDWFTRYHETVQKTLNGPVGRIPVHIGCRIRDGMLHVEIEDRGMGFLVREQLQKAAKDDSPTGRGLGLIQKLVNGTLTYDNGGRISRFVLPIRPRQKEQGAKALRSKTQTYGWVYATNRAPLMERALRAAGVQQLNVSNSIKDVQDNLTPDSLLVLDASAPNFAQLAYFVNDVQRKHAQLPILLWGHRTQTAAATQLALNTPCMDVAPADLSPEDLALRIERLLQTMSAVQKNTNLQLNHQMELERTRGFQHDMLPDAGKLTSLAEKHKIQLACSYRGCETLAGDYWNVTERDPTKLALTVMDFTGHGMRAALNTVQLHTLLQTVQKTANPLATVLMLNNQLHRLLGPGCFAAYAYVIYDSSTGEISYCAGGAPPLLLKRANGRMEVLPGSGLPLGLTREISPDVHSAKLEPGDTLLITSDALTDSPHHNGTRWGPEGLAEVWRKVSPGLKPHQAMESLLETFHKTVVLPIPDDLTVLALKRPTLN